MLLNKTIFLSTEPKTTKKRNAAEVAQMYSPRRLSARDRKHL